MKTKFKRYNIRGSYGAKSGKVTLLTVPDSNGKWVKHSDVDYFGKLLGVYLADTIIEFPDARAVMREHLKNPALRQAYVANIAMCMHDNISVKASCQPDPLNCNEVAEKLIKLIWGPE